MWPDGEIICSLFGHLYLLLNHFFLLHSAISNNENLPCKDCLSVVKNVLNTKKPIELQNTINIFWQNLLNLITKLRNFDWILCLSHLNDLNFQLTFKKGELITVTQKEDGGWWEGTSHETGKTGWFPSNYVKEIDDAFTVSGPVAKPETAQEILAKQVWTFLFSEELICPGASKTIKHYCILRWTV